VHIVGLVVCLSYR